MAFCSLLNPASKPTPYRLDKSSMMSPVSPIGSPSSSIQGFLPFGPFRGGVLNHLFVRVDCRHSAIGARASGP